MKNVRRDIMSAQPQSKFEGNSLFTPIVRCPAAECVVLPVDLCAHRDSRSHSCRHDIPDGKKRGSRGQEAPKPYTGGHEMAEKKLSRDIDVMVQELLEVRQELLCRLSTANQWLKTAGIIILCLIGVKIA
jgi:hypothetical protein